MALHTLYREQLLQTDLQTLWDFIASPANLNLITPDDMKFEILSKKLPEIMYPGMIISYYVKPFPWYKTQWVTEITQVKDKFYFVDEQRIGPYRLWHHEHILESKPDGILMRDIIHYQVPGGWIGDLLNKLVIEKKLNRIFKFRFNKMQELLSK